MLAETGSRDLADELQELRCVQLKEAIKTEARERKQRLKLQRRRFWRDNAILAFVGAIVALHVGLPGSRLPTEILSALIAFAAMTSLNGCWAAREMTARR